MNKKEASQIIQSYQDYRHWDDIIMYPIPELDELNDALDFAVKELWKPDLIEISKYGNSVVITIDWHAETRLYPNWYCHEITQDWDFTKVVIHNNKPWKQTNHKTHSLTQSTETGTDIDTKRDT